MVFSDRRSPSTREPYSDDGLKRAIAAPIRLPFHPELL